MTIADAALPTIAAALDSSETIVVVFDLPHEDGAPPTLSEASGAFLRFSGFARAEAAGRPLTFFAAPDAAALPAIDTALAAYQHYRGELACRAKDGSQKFLGLHLMPVTAPASQTLHYVLIGRDITAQRREGAQSRLVQALLLKSFMLADRAVALLAPDERIIMANPRCEAALAVEPGSLTGRHLQDIILPPYRQIVIDARASLSEENARCQADVELDCHHGVSGLVMARFLRLGGGELAGITSLTILPHKDGTTLPPRLRNAGKIRFLSLDAVRAAIDGDWETASAHVLNTAEQIIRRRLLPEDLLTRTADKGFTICFAHGTEDDASELAAAAARDIMLHLVGRGHSADAVQLAVTTALIAVSGEDPPDMEQIGRHLDHVEEAAKSGVPPPPPPEQILTTGGAPHPASFLRSQPRQRSIIVRQTIPESNLDREVAALLGATSLPAQNLILVEVAFATFLSRPSTDAYLHACAQLPEQVRGRLYPVLSPLARGTTQSLLQSLMQRLHGNCAGFALRLADLHTPEFDLTTCRPAAAVIDMAAWDNGRAVPAERLSTTTRLMHAYRVRVLALNVASVEVGLALQGLGVDWMTLAR